MIFGDYLKDIIKSHNLSNRSFARSIHICDSTVQGYLINRNVPGPEIAKRISKMYGIPYEEIAEKIILQQYVLMCKKYEIKYQ